MNYTVYFRVVLQELYAGISGLRLLLADMGSANTHKAAIHENVVFKGCHCPIRVTAGHIALTSCLGAEPKSDVVVV